MVQGVSLLFTAPPTLKASEAYQIPYRLEIERPLANVESVCFSIDQVDQIQSAPLFPFSWLLSGKSSTTSSSNNSNSGNNKVWNTQLARKLIFGLADENGCIVVGTYSGFIDVCMPESGLLPPFSAQVDNSVITRKVVASFTIYGKGGIPLISEKINTQVLTHEPPSLYAPMIDELLSPVENANLFCARLKLKFEKRILLTQSTIGKITIAIENYSPSLYNSFNETFFLDSVHLSQYLESKCALFNAIVKKSQVDSADAGAAMKIIPEKTFKISKDQIVIEPGTCEVCVFQRIQLPKDFSSSFIDPFWISRRHSLVISLGRKDSRNRIMKMTYEVPIFLSNDPQHSK